MADEYREIAENNDNGNSKKKKIIIGVIAAVVIVVVIAVVCALALGNGEEKYTDTPVSDEATTQLEPGVENGVFVDSVPNDVTNNVTTSQDSDGSNSSSDGQSGSSGSSGNSGSSDNSGSSGNSGSSEDSGSSGDSGSSDNDSNENTPRQMDVYIVLPNDGNVSDTLYVYVNGELVKEEGISATLNGQVFHFKTDESYTGSVTVEARLENYGTSAKQKSNNTSSQIVVALPLDSSEENMAPAI